MKQIICFLFAGFTLISCDPDNKDIFNTERVKIYGVLSDTLASIKLGDTISVTVVLPDTVVSNTGTFPVSSVQNARFDMPIWKIDSVTKRGVLVDKQHYWVTRGELATNSLFHYQLTYDSKPRAAIISFKPAEKGIYCFNVTSQPGQLKINNAYEARLVVSFDVLDRHTNLAVPVLGTAWADDARTRDAGTYVFRVD